MFLRPLWLGVGLVVLAGCARPVAITLSVSPDHEEIWQTLVQQSPPPEDVSFVSAGEAAVQITETTGVAGHGAADGAIVLARTWLAPVASLSEFEAEDDPDNPLLPLEEIRLPERALSADGRYPGDPDYPFVQEVAIRFRVPDLSEARRRQREPIREWFASLRTAAEREATAAGTINGVTTPPDARTPAGPFAAPEIVWIGGVGDIMLERGMTALLARPDGLEHVFDDVLPYMQSVDLLLGNLEGAVSRRGSPLPKGFTFRFDPIVLPRLREAGFDYLSIVNNHSYDYGEQAFLDSLDHLDSAGIGTSGAGRTLAGASRPWVVSVGNTEVRVLGAGAYPIERSGFDGARSTVASETRPGVLWAGPRNPTAQRQMFEAMEEAFSPESFDIVSIHGGAEWALAPAQWQRELYRTLIDRGADLVLGHHSHVVQGLEAHNGGLIAYSLGNFVFPGMFLTDFGEESLFLRVGVHDGVIRYVDAIPVSIDHQLLRLDSGDALLTRMADATRRLADR